MNIRNRRELTTDGAGGFFAYAVHVVDVDASLRESGWRCGGGLCRGRDVDYGYCFDLRGWLGHRCVMFCSTE